MNSTVINNTTIDLAETYQVLGPFFVSGYALVLLPFVYALYRLLNAKGSFTKRNQENSNMKFNVSCLGIGSAVCCITLFTCFAVVGPAVPAWQPQLSDGEQRFQVWLQGTAYSLSVAFDLHICGYWMLLMSNFVRSSCGIDSRSGSNTVARYGKLKKFKPTYLEWAFFVASPYAGCLAICVTSILAWTMGFEWTLVENIRIFCATMTVSIVAFVNLSVREVLKASANLRSLVDNYTGGTDTMGSGVMRSATRPKKRDRNALITLAKRTRNMSYYIMACCLSVAPCAIFIASTNYLATPVIFLSILTFLQSCHMFWLYVVYFSVLRQIAPDRPEYQQTASTFQMGSSFRNGTEVDTMQVSENPMSFKDVIEIIENDEYDIESKL